ncbi:MAG TPA: OmpH family outer membrane protein [Pirellulales bacterium]|nr:OmpH family outer membrane protein [Pirellulales bacterium]
MRRSSLIAVVGTAFVCILTVSTWGTGADEPKIDRKPIAVATVDVGKLLRAYPALKARLDPLREEIEVAEQAHRKRLARLEKKKERLASLPPDTQEAKGTALEVFTEQEAITNDANATKNRFFEREAVAYIEAYDEAIAEVSEYAEAQGIDLVLRLDRTSRPLPMDMIKGELQSTVLFHRGVDITDSIIRLVNAKGPK